ncbi:MAG: thrombospondin type 3 repeat-containing protein, partial [Flavobacteriales bacterium]
MNNLIRVFVLLLGVLVYSQNTLSVMDGAYGYDQDFKLDINLKSVDNIKALQFDLNFDENNFTYASTHTLYSDRLGGSASEYSITVKSVSDSKIRVLIYSSSNRAFDIGEGKLLDFDFKNSLNFGDYSFSVTNVVASLMDNSSASLTLVNGTIRTKAPGFWKQYSEVDFGSIYKGSTESRTLNLQNTGNSDLTITLVKNELSKFTIKDSSGNDIQWPIVLTSKEDSDNGNGNWTFQLVFGFEAEANGSYEEAFSFTTDEPKSKDTVHEFKIKATVYNENKLIVQSNVEAYNDQESKVNVSISGDESITSFQFDITPNNSKIVFVDGSAKLLNTTTDHSISSKVLSNSEGKNYLRVICYSSTNAVFTQPIGDIVEFSVKPTELGPGNYNLNISNPVLTNSGLVDVTSSTENGSISLNAAKLTFIPTTTYDVGEVLRNTSSTHNFSIKNDGNTKLTISNITPSDPNLIISNPTPIEIDEAKETRIDFDLLATTSNANYSSYVVVQHDSGVKSDTLNITATLKSRNTVQLQDATLSNGSTKEIPLNLLNSDNVKGLQFDLTLPKESKTFSWTLTADGSSDYVFAEKDNAKDPDLVHYVGDKINFINNAGSTHPLYIVTKNDSGYDVANELSGVVNQGASSGTVTLDLSDVLPGTYYYICGNHASMTGKITILPKFSISTGSSNLISDRSSGFNLTQSLLSARKYRFLLYNDSNSTFSGNIGNILNLPITVSDITDSTMLIADGSYLLTIDNIIISGSDNTNITSISQGSSKAVFSSVNLFSPVIESNQSVSVNENPTADVFFYTVIATDSDDNSFVNDYKIVSGNDSNTFGISSNSGELYVKVPANIDYENVQSYSLGITVSDGTKTSAVENVTVAIIDDPNVFVTEDLTVAIYRDNTGSGIITDDYNNLNNNKTSSRSSKSEDTQKVIYSVDSGIDKEFFNINSSSGQLSFISAPSFSNPQDANKDNVYEVTLKAENIDDVSVDVPVITSRKSISILENNSTVTSVTTLISQATSDADGDGIIDTQDICPTIANPDQADSDGNGEGDACQDTDGDGILDKNDICPIIVNPGQEDSDGDGIGDV